MDRSEHARGLLHMARKDFDALRGMGENPLFADEIFGFHAQQAIEKGLKAWLALHAIRFPLTHDLSRLLALLEEHGMNVTAWWPLVQYTIFAVQARYEVELMGTEPPLDRPAVIEEVERLLATVDTCVDRAAPD